MNKRSFFIRNLNAGIYLENFLIAGVASVLAIRLFLRITGYPQIGGSGLHVAHLLFGGIFMLISIMILLSFLSRATERLAAILGGIGFGLFIDEVGKFVTSDTNYFFKPAVAIIYLSFIMIFLAIRTIQTGRNQSSQEYLMNALQEMKEAALNDSLDEDNRDRLLEYIEKSNSNNPLVGALRYSVSQIPSSLPKRPWISSRIRRSTKSFYQAITRFRAFQYVIVAFFVAVTVIKIIYAFVLVFLIGLRWEQILDIGILGHFAKRAQDLSFINWAELASSLLAGVFTFLGLLWIRHSRLLAFRMFERSILVSIFITQVFMFYKHQFSALLGFFLNILILVALRFMIDQERSWAEAKPGHSNMRASDDPQGVRSTL